MTGIYKIVKGEEEGEAELVEVVALSVEFRSGRMIGSIVGVGVGEGGRVGSGEGEARSVCCCCCSSRRRLVFGIQIRRR